HFVLESKNDKELIIGLFIIGCMMTNINVRQNERISLERIAAQRQTYSEAKLRIGIYLVFSVFIMILLNFIAKPLLINDEFLNIIGFKKIDITNYIAIYALLLSFLELVYLKKIIPSMKEKGAKIQEIFDCYALDIKWNKVICGSEVNDFDIKTASDAYQKKHSNWEDLVDWYTPSVEVLQESKVKATLLCQQENLSWDLAQRKSFVSLVNLITFSFVFISFSISIYYGLTLESFILSVVIPCWPLVNFCVVNNYENSESIRDKKG
ncbi:hypothetical protein EAY27_25950, partial [Vibrio anguillarum]|nr:hypothetical protein [Vibrio anguillarum]